jgi:hypothetical protein
MLYRGLNFNNQNLINLNYDEKLPVLVGVDYKFKNQSKNNGFDDEEFVSIEEDEHPHPVNDSQGKLDNKQSHMQIQIQPVQPPNQKKSIDDLMGLLNTLPVENSTQPINNDTSNPPVQNMNQFPQMPNMSQMPQINPMNTQMNFQGTNFQNFPQMMNNFQSFPNHVNNTQINENNKNVVNSNVHEDDEFVEAEEEDQNDTNQKNSIQTTSNTIEPKDELNFNDLIFNNKSLPIKKNENDISNNTTPNRIINSTPMKQTEPLQTQKTLSLDDLLSSAEFAVVKPENPPIIEIPIQKIEEKVIPFQENKLDSKVEVDDFEFTEVDEDNPNQNGNDEIGIPPHEIKKALDNNFNFFAQTPTNIPEEKPSAPSKPSILTYTQDDFLDEFKRENKVVETKKPGEEEVFEFVV